MRDVVVIGGGISGLAAVRELEAAGLDCALIEVKRRLGGSLNSVRVGDFIFDCGPMRLPIHDIAYFAAYVRELEPISEEAIHIDGPGAVIFEQGTHALVEAMRTSIRSTVMLRMAVSSLGFLDTVGHSFGVCLENGILMAARAIVIAAPARYAERMLYTLVPEIAMRLLDYRYDTIAYVSLGYENLSAADFNDHIPEGYPLTTVAVTNLPGRVPPGGLLVQVGLRFDPVYGLPADPVGEITALMSWPANPAADHIHHWPESDPVMWRDSGHLNAMRAIEPHLPQGVALAGSDYISSSAPPCLDERILSGIYAAERVMRWLRYL